MKTLLARYQIVYRTIKPSKSYRSVGPLILTGVVEIVNGIFDEKDSVLLKSYSTQLMHLYGSFRILGEISW